MKKFLARCGECGNEVRPKRSILDMVVILVITAIVSGFVDEIIQRAYDASITSKRK